MRVAGEETHADGALYVVGLPCRNVDGHVAFRFGFGTVRMFSRRSVFEEICAALQCADGGTVVPHVKLNGCSLETAFAEEIDEPVVGLHRWRRMLRGAGHARATAHQQRSATQRGNPRSYIEHVFPLLVMPADGRGDVTRCADGSTRSGGWHRNGAVAMIRLQVLRRKRTLVR